MSFRVGPEITYQWLVASDARIIGGKSDRHFPMSQQRIYRISFLSQGKVYEIYARAISHGGLLGFIEAEKLLFGEKSTVVVDPTEEKLKAEFAGVERTYIPVHAVLRIDQVTQNGGARIRESDGHSARIMPFPVFTAGGDQQKS